MLKKVDNVQSWIPYDEITYNGIIKMKNKCYIKILKVLPINFNLKTDFEKESILNSYKYFLKTCNFDMQILIQSKKENLNQNIKKIQENSKEEFISEITKNYIEFIRDMNEKSNSSSKNFFILIKNSNINNEKNDYNMKEVCIEQLRENTIKIKEALNRCGNIVMDYTEKNDIEEILYSFLNCRLYNKSV